MIFVMLKSKTKVNLENSFLFPKQRKNKYISPPFSLVTVTHQCHEFSPPNTMIFERKEGLPKQNSSITARAETELFVLCASVDKWANVFISSSWLQFLPLGRLGRWDHTWALPNGRAVGSGVVCLYLGGKCFAHMLKYASLTEQVFGVLWHWQMTRQRLGGFS